MAARKTRLKLGVAAVGLLGVAGVVVLLVDFSSPQLGKAALDEASGTLGLRLRASSFHFNLARGLVLDDVRASFPFPGGRLEVHLNQLVLEPRLLPLLAGKVVVSAATIKRPRLNLVGARGQPPSGRRETGEKDRSSSDEEQASAPPTPGFELRSEIAELRLEDGAVISSGAGGSFPSLVGISCQLRNLDFTPGALSPLHGLSAVGTIQVEEIALPSTVVREFRGSIEAERGRFRFEELGFVTGESSFRATLSMDFNRLPFGYTLSLAGGPLDLDALLGSPDRARFGPGVLGLEAEGFGWSSKNMKGKGRLNLEPGTLPSLPILTGIEEALDRDGLVGAAYRATEVGFRLENGELTWERFQLDTDGGRLDWSGSAGLDGRLNLRVIVEIPPDALTGGPQRVAVPLRVTGTMDHPRVGRDSDARSSPVVESAR